MENLTSPTQEVENRFNVLKLFLALVLTFSLFLGAIFIHSGVSNVNLFDSTAVIIEGVLVNTVSTLAAFVMSYLLFEPFRQAINKLNLDLGLEQKALIRKQKTAFDTLQKLIQASPNSINSQQLHNLADEKIIDRTQLNYLGRLIDIHNS